MRERMQFSTHIIMVDSKFNWGGSLGLIDSSSRTSKLTMYSNGAIMSSTSDFQTFWKNVASEFASNDLVVFDTSKSKPQATY